MKSITLVIEREKGAITIEVATPKTKQEFLFADTFRVGTVSDDPFIVNIFKGYVGKTFTYEVLSSMLWCLSVRMLAAQEVAGKSLYKLTMEDDLARGTWVIRSATLVHK